MWGMESQRRLVRERMKLLLEAHDSEIEPVELTAEPGELLLRQGEPAKRILLLTEGSVAIQVRQSDGLSHTLAIVEAEELLGEMGLDPALDDLCGLYSGIPLTERRHDASGELPETIHVFRRGIIDEAGGWEPGIDEDGIAFGGDDEVLRQIRITVLHEIGHHFGLSEDELAALGYE